jgi:hypothetical protein
MHNHLIKDVLHRIASLIDGIAGLVCFCLLWILIFAVWFRTFAGAV